MKEIEDPYLYPEKDAKGYPVLKNKFGIRNYQSLDKIEAELSSLKEVLLKEAKIERTFDLEHLKKIHKHLFGSIYEWAGETRTINMSKAGSRFMPENLIVTFSDIVTDKLRNENYFKGQPKEKFVDSLSNFYKTWNEIHPFREGNGRSTRILLAEVSENAGYVFRQEVVERNKQLWNRAAARSVTSNGNDQTELKALMSQIVIDARAYHLSRTKPEIALKKFPELLPIYVDINNKIKEIDPKSPDYNKEYNNVMSREFRQHVYEINAGKSKFITTLPGLQKEPVAAVSKVQADDQKGKSETKNTSVSKGRSKGLER